MRKIKTYKSFGIYQRSQKEIEKAARENLLVYEFEIFLPDESPSELCSPEWEAQSLKECIDFLEDR